MTNLLKLYRDSRDVRYKLYSWMCLVGIITTLLSLIGLPGSRTAANFFLIFIMYPSYVLVADAIPKIWKSSLVFKLAMVVMLVSFASVFYGEEVATAKIVSKFIRRIIQLVGFIVGISVAMPLIKKHQKYIFYALLLCSLAAGVSLFIFYTSPSLTRLAYHYGDLHTNRAGWIYGLIAASLLASFQKGPNRLVQGLTFLALTILFTAIMLTSSRSTILGVFIILPTFILLSRDKRCWPPILAIIIAMSIYTSTAHSLKGSDKGRLVSTERLVNRKDAGRFQFWKELIDRMDTPEYVVGKGFLADHTSKERDPKVFCIPHSLYVSSFFHGGFIMLSLHALLLCSVGIVGLKDIKNGSMGILLLAGFALVPSLTDGKSIIDLSNKFPAEVLLFWIPVAIATATQYLPTAKTKSIAPASGME